MRRRDFIAIAAGSAVASFGYAALPLMDNQLKSYAAVTPLSPPIEPAPTLLSAPIELAGDWGHMLPRSADAVVERMRHACLAGVRLLFDRQPTRLRVDE